ncbi:MAG: DUF4433 domain-containing protein [Gammaproteobacteria bacterium]|nr:DUF4433 domain-containing protein [Gammaproteobacteria bacterium]
MAHSYKNLNPEKAFIWRIVHRDNLPWIWANGLHCGNSALRSPAWVNIGNEDLIQKRATRPVPVAPGGALNDYVPFYFTPFSLMMYNIHTGRGVLQRSNAEIVILVSSLPRLQELGIPFVFTDKHAKVALARFFSDTAQLDQVDWPLLQSRNFSRDPNDPEKLERYQAEALVHRHCPISALLGAVCYTDQIKHDIDAQLAGHGLNLDVHAMPGWYF